MGHKYEGFEYNLVHLVKILTFSGLRHVAALSNTINCNTESVCPVISNVLAKREDLYQELRSYTTAMK